MKFKTVDHFNPWFVDGKQVTRIFLYDSKGVQLTVARGWLESVLNAAFLITRPIGSLDAVKRVTSRRTVRLDRAEHFLFKSDLYLFLPSLGRYSDAVEVKLHDNATSESFIMQLSVHTAVNGDEPDWHVIRAAYTHATRDKPNASIVERMVALFNEKVPDHPNRGISEFSMLRLVEILPELQGMAKELEAVCSQSKQAPVT